MESPQSYQERIDYLLKNPWIAETILVSDFQPSEGQAPIKCNPHGTVLFIVGRKDLVEYYDTDNNHRLHIPSNSEESPDFVSGKIMAEILEERCRNIQGPEIQPGDIVSIWRKYPKSTGEQSPETLIEQIFRLEHSAILLNPSSEEIFHKRATFSLEFEKSNITKYITEAYITPAARNSNVFVEFYRINPAD